MQSIFVFARRRSAEPIELMKNVSTLATETQKSVQIFLFIQPALLANHSDCDLEGEEGFPLLDKTDLARAEPFLTAIIQYSIKKSALKVETVICFTDELIYVAICTEHGKD